MVYVIAAVLLLLNAGALCLVLFGLPGTWLMLGITGLTAWLRPGMFGTRTLLAAVALAVLGEVAELLCGMLGSRLAGGAPRSPLGALAGAIVGGILGTALIPIPLVGTVTGAACGALAGATAVNLRSGQPFLRALKAGSGAAAGQVAGTFAKLALGVSVWILLTVAAFV
jgi:uncharacterized protein YqgC (DUF456 family)